MGLSENPHRENSSLSRSACSLVVLGMLFLVGCGTQRDAASVPDKTSREPVRVKLGLNWHPEAEHGGFFAALEHGFFAEEGLDVEILPGGPGAPVLQEVGLGRIEFAVDNADKLIFANAQGTDLQAVLAPIQTSPRCIMVRADSGIESFEQLAKLPKFTLAMNSGHPFAKFLMKTYRLENVQVVPYQNVAMFFVEANYGQQAYSFSEPFLAEQKGVKPRSLMLADTGFNTYTSLLLTRKTTIDEHPDLVAKMVRASRRGWRKYLEDPTATNARISALNPEMGADILTFGVAALRPLCVTEDCPVESLGEMTPARWITLIQQMESCGALEVNRVRADQLYTTKFLNADESSQP